MTVSWPGAAIVAVALLNVALTVRRVARKRAGIGPLLFALGTMALSLAVFLRVIPPVYRWAGAAAVEAYILIVAARALMRGDDAAIEGYLPTPLARLFQTELRVLRLAFRAPAFIASRRTPTAATYGETSKWESFAMIALVALVPDSVVLALIPVSPWWHVLLIAVSLYATMWILGAYGAVISMPHELSAERRIFHNGVFGTIDATAACIKSVRVLRADERRRVVRRNETARAMSCPGTRMVAVEFEGDARMTPLVGASRRIPSPIFASSDVPDELARLLVGSAGAAEPSSNSDSVHRFPGPASSV